ncbi:putative (S)-norcoclaurine synthase [Helianthus annuus]|nr:putative (S)-norcoclaurine synthase [Helianthus annuus]KAJ0686900.1 putative (S)-norcoclaurine synthase [Helianthus annuus]
MESKGTTIFGVSLPVPNVQELAKEPLERVPPRYTRPDQDSPIISSTTSSRPQLPIIDMERLSSKDYVHSEIEKLHLACRDWGFFQVRVWFTYISKCCKTRSKGECSQSNRCKVGCHDNFLQVRLTTRNPSNVVNFSQNQI